MKDFFKRGRKNSDPISDKARELNQRIASLENKIQKLHTQMEQTAPPKLRSTALPHSPPVPNESSAHRPQKELVFEPVDQDRIQNGSHPAPGPEHLAELPTRKLNMVSFWEKIRVLFKGNTTSNPTLFKYLAAGNIQGLRPLRYEKRVERNRFILYAVIFIGVLVILIEIIRR